jgi:hypothetical protein
LHHLVDKLTAKNLELEAKILELTEKPTKELHLVKETYEN